MKRAFLYAELLITIGLLSVFAALWFGWWKGFSVNVNTLENYYQNRNELVNLAESGAGTSVKVTENIYLRTVSANNLELQYLQYTR